MHNCVAYYTMNAELQLINLQRMKTLGIQLINFFFVVVVAVLFFSKILTQASKKNVIPYRASYF